uniref:Fungal lipase-type domain-containing protein n=1 Tax=Leersia perrieri TaxID=77586 RepID=A0A0D9V937_9ORYZ
MANGAAAVATKLRPLARDVTPALERKTTTTAVAAMWRRLQGSDNWEGILDGETLRGEVARYGELVDACYRAFDLDPTSRRHLNCKYGKERMLAECGLAGAGYVITRYIYAAASSAAAGRWIGYVAVSDDATSRRIGRRDVLVSFRGTVTTEEWMANLKSSLVPARLGGAGVNAVNGDSVKVESGFLDVYTSADETSSRFGGAGSCREQLLREVGRLLASFSGEGDDVSVTLAGHSMGAALAMLLGYDMAGLGLNVLAGGEKIPVTVVSFGGPRVGNAAFKARCDELGVKALRVTNARDPITRLPGVFLNESTTAGAGVLRPWRDACYTHVGVELQLDSSFKVGELAAVHDLSTYISLLRADDKKSKQHAAVKREERGGGGVMGKVMEMVGRRRVGALPWHDAAMLQMGGLVQTLGII